MVLRSSITDFISFTPVLPCQVSLVVGVVEEGTSKNDRKVSKVEVGSPWRGLCSGQLLGLEVLDFFFCNIMINQILNFFQIGQKLPAFFRSSSFKLPEDPTKPVITVPSPLGIQFTHLILSLFLSQKVIMIAAGSGIAPFRSFWQARMQQAEVGLAPSSLYSLEHFLKLEIIFVLNYFPRSGRSPPWSDNPGLWLQKGEHGPSEEGD